MAIIESVTRIAGDFVFTTTGNSGLGGFSRAKERTNKRMKAAKPWTFHDLRRTASTGMSSLGVQPHVVEAVINHISGSKAGVAGTYNRWAYLPEKTHALQLWADHLERLVVGKPAAKVIPIRSRRS